MTSFGRRPHRGTNRWLMAVALLVMAIEFGLYRRWHLRWGATHAEVTAAMPGDDRLTSAAFAATRAITIAAQPERVWSWLLQVGFGRGGFYSYDLLDNLGRRSAERIDPTLQTLAVGDWIPMSAQVTDRTAFRVGGMAAPHWMLWTKPDSTWEWRLEPADGGSTRLVTRLRCRYAWRDFPGVLATIALMELADYPMMRRMLMGIRDRAEALAVGTRPAP